MGNAIQYAVGLVLAGCLMAWPAVTNAQSPSTGSSTTQQGQQSASGQSGQTTQQQGQQPANQDPNAAPQTGQTGQPSQTGPIPIGQDAPPPPPPPDPKAAPAATPPAGQPGADTPVPQQQTVHPKNAKEDVDAIGNRNPGKGVNFYSLEKEIALGKQLAQEVERSSKLIDDPVVTEYVNRVGQNLVRNSDAQVPFTIKVIDSDEVNAFALPGGFFYVNSGLILRAQEEAELAGRDGARNLSRDCAARYEEGNQGGNHANRRDGGDDFCALRMGRVWYIPGHEPGNSADVSEIFARR